MAEDKEGEMTTVKTGGGIGKVAGGSGGNGILHPGIPGWAQGAVPGMNVPNVPVRQKILRVAAEIISGDRQSTYGDAKAGFTRTGKMWAAILGLDEVTPEQVALCMNALKISRLCDSPTHQDSWIDGAGYLALGGEIATRR